MKKKSALSFCFASLLFAACNGSSTNDGSLTICRNLPANDNCAVNLAYLSCTFVDDAGDPQNELCLSDNVNQCPDGNGLGGTCTNQCNSGEYGATCGGPPSGDAAPPSDVPPSSSCRSLSHLPNGVAIYCCPCGS